MHKYVQTRNIIILLSTALIFHCIASLSQANSPLFWNDLKLYGGQINAVAVSPQNPEILFCGSWLGGGLFKSTNGGKTWQSVDGFRNKIVYAIDIVESSPETIWVACLQGIYKSFDRGVTWLRYDPASTANPLSMRDYYALAIDQTHAQTVYIGAGGIDGSERGGTVYKTTDGGSSWIKLPLTADHIVVDIAVNPLRPSQVWAVTWESSYARGGIYRTDNAGKSWHRIMTGLPSGWFDVVLIHPDKPDTVLCGGANGVYQTENTGKTWHKAQDKIWCTALCFNNSNTDIIYASWIDEKTLDFEFATSLDSGKTWSTVKTEELLFLSLAHAPSKDNTALYGGEISFGMYKSTDQGQTWHPLNEGIAANTVFDVAVSPFDTSLIMVGAMSGVYLQKGTGVFKKINPGSGDAVAFDHELDHVFYTASQYSFGISTDGGASWDYVDFSEDINITTLVPDDKSYGVIYIGGYRDNNTGFIYKSTDRGTTWKRVLKANAPVNTIALNPSDNYMLYAGTGAFFSPVKPGCVFKSSDKGETWEKTALQGKVVNTIAVDPLLPNMVYAGVAEYGFFKSNDAGATWTSQNGGLPEEASIMDIVIDRQNPQRMYVGSFVKGVFFTTADSSYWTFLGLPQYTIFTIQAIHAAKENIYYDMPGDLLFIPPGGIIAGTRSGLYQYNASGMSVVTGTVTDAQSSAGIADVLITTDRAEQSISGEDGYYILLLQPGACTVTTEKLGFKPHHETISIAPSETRELFITLEPDTSSPPSESDCPLELLLSKDESLSLKTLRAFRDKILEKTYAGKKTIALYYRYAPAMNRVLTINDCLFSQARKLLLCILPAIRSMVDDHRENFKKRPILVNHLPQGVKR